MHALNLAADGRILSATAPKFAPRGVMVETLPDGDIADWRYVNGRYIYDPLPTEAPAATATQLDRVEAQTIYTALMTDTLLEEDE